MGRESTARKLTFSPRVETDRPQAFGCLIQPGGQSVAEIGVVSSRTEGPALRVPGAEVSVPRQIGTGQDIADSSATRRGSHYNARAAAQRTCDEYVAGVSEWAGHAAVLVLYFTDKSGHVSIPAQLGSVDVELSWDIGGEQVEIF